MVGGFNDVEEAVSMSAATSEAKQRASVSMTFQVLHVGDETAGARVVGQDMALACLRRLQPGRRATGSQDSSVAGLQGGFTLKACCRHIMRFHPNRPTVSC